MDARNRHMTLVLREKHLTRVSLQYNTIDGVHKLAVLRYKTEKQSEWTKRKPGIAVRRVGRETRKVDARRRSNQAFRGKERRSRRTYYTNLHSEGACTHTFFAGSKYSCGTCVSKETLFSSFTRLFWNLLI